MPYITQERRAALALRDVPQTAGELNYLFTVLIRDYFEAHHNYQGINDIVGALEGAKLEFVRRKVAEYENIKIVENGDAY